METPDIGAKIFGVLFKKKLAIVAKKSLKQHKSEFNPFFALMNHSLNTEQ